MDGHNFRNEVGTRRTSRKREREREGQTERGEREDWLEEHLMEMPEPPGPITQRTETSDQMVRSQGDKEKWKEMANPDRTNKASERWQSNGLRRGRRKSREGPMEGREDRGLTLRKWNKDQ